MDTEVGGKSVISDITDTIKDAIMGDLNNIIREECNKTFEIKINDIGY